MSQRETDAAAVESVKVTIFNQTYSLRSSSGGEHVRAVARIVDERMRHIAEQLAVHDVAKVAVLTALNIADELQSLRDYYEKEVLALFAATPEGDDDAGAAAVAAPADEASPEVRDDHDAAAPGEEAEGRPAWFDALFEHDDSKGAQRMSSQISSRLQRLRQARQGESIIDAEE